MRSVVQAYVDGVYPGVKQTVDEIYRQKIAVGINFYLGGRTEVTSLSHELVQFLMEERLAVTGVNEEPFILKFVQLAHHLGMEPRRYELVNIWVDFRIHSRAERALSIAQACDANLK
jgi:hypothetical protein